MSARLDTVRGSPVQVIVELCSAPAVSELRPLSAPECAELMGGLTSAVHELELHGLCSRDITPDHVHFDARRGARLRDTGMPLDLFPRPPVDRDRHLPYRSPEELAGAQPDARSAVYSLGAVLFYALTGRAPFGGAWSRIYVSHTDAERPRPSEHRRGISAEFDAVVAQAMAIDRADRYVSPMALARGVAAAAGTSVLHEPLMPEPVVSNGRPPTPTKAPEPVKPRVTLASRVAERVRVSPGAGARLAAAARSLVELADKRVAAGARIARADATDGQIDAARSLESAYARASARIRDGGAAGHGARTLVAGLDASARAYGALAAAVEAGDQTAYDTAQAQVTAAEASVWGDGSSADEPSARFEHSNPAPVDLADVRRS